MRPPGAVVMLAPVDLLGKGIAMASNEPFSHTAVALGNGEAVHSTHPRVRIDPENYWGIRKQEWYEPTVPFSLEEVRLLRSYSYSIEDRVEYYYKNLWDFLIKGSPDERGHGLFCTHLVAEAYMLARDIDFSGTEEPWKIDITRLVGVLRESGHFQPMED